MARGYRPIKAKSDGRDDIDKYFMKTMKYYCKGRGCRHSGEPYFNPTAICLYIRGSASSHLEIYQRIEDLLPMYPGAKILSIQFVPLAVHLDTLETDNRNVQRCMVIVRNRNSAKEIDKLMVDHAEQQRSKEQIGWYVNTYQRSEGHITSL